jgi:hypothetical protein
MIINIIYLNPFIHKGLFIYNISFIKDYLLYHRRNTISYMTISEYTIEYFLYKLLNYTKMTNLMNDFDKEYSNEIVIMESIKNSIHYTNREDVSSRSWVFKGVNDNHIDNRCMFCMGCDDCEKVFQSLFCIKCGDYKNTEEVQYNICVLCSCNMDEDILEEIESENFVEEKRCI